VEHFPSNLVKERNCIQKEVFMRDRREDLGRIAVLLSNVLDHEIFREDRMRAKDFPEWFRSQDSDKQWEILNRFAYGLESVQWALGDISEIALGQDMLNDNAPKL
jgi:hypothetical protein